MAGGRLPPPSEPPQNYEYCEYYEYCVGGIFHHCMILAGCVSQRHARGPGGGSMVMPGARGAFAALGVVLLCGPATTANLRLRLLVLQVLQVLQPRRVEADAEKNLTNASW